MFPTSFLKGQSYHLGELRRNHKKKAIFLLEIGPLKKEANAGYQRELCFHEPFATNLPRHRDFPQRDFPPNIHPPQLFDGNATGRDLKIFKPKPPRSPPNKP